MLNPANRTQYQNLLEAAFWAEGEDRPVLTMVASHKDPIVVTRTVFQTGIRAQAALLTEAGVNSGDLVVIAHDQDLLGIYRFWAAILVGAIPSLLPPLTEKLDPDVYQRNMSTLVDRSKVKLVMTTDAHVSLLEATVNCPVMGDSRVAEIGVRAVMADPDASAVAFLQHSSGTTGLQKGVALTHEAVLNQIANYSEAIQLGESDVVVSWLPLYHDMGLIAGFLLPLVQGIPLVLMSPFDWVRRPALLLEAISAHGGTLCWLPNFAYNHMARRVRAREVEGLSLASMRAFVNCSEPVRAESHELFMERFAELGVTREMMTVSYAMAENTFAVTQTALGKGATVLSVDPEGLAERLQVEPAGPNQPHRLIVSCGLSIAGTNIRIVNEYGQQLAEQQVGEVAIQSDCMLTGYYKRPDLEPLEDGWYLTGDRGFMVHGELYVIGRSKDLIINAGKNVFPQDIEAIVNELPGIHPGRVVAFGVADEKEGTELIAVLAEVETKEPAERKRINQQIRQSIARQTMVSVTFVQLVPPQWLLKTSSGKIARAANREKWQHERF